jgi:peroxidase
MGRCTSCFLLAVVLVFTLGGVSDATLNYDYYKTSCPKVESIIYQEISKAYAKDNTVAPGILRLIFHDCFVRGCDASVLLAGPNTERAAIQNAGLHGFEAIDAAKAAVEKACPGVVSCADILAYASRDTVILTKGLGWKVPAGRKDGKVSLATDPPQNLPPATFTSAQLVANFAAKGLSAKQMVDLSGSHTIGVTHCVHLRDRIFSVIDPTMPKSLLAELQQKCPTNTTPTALVIDRYSVHRFDTQYFANIADGNGLMTSDQDLYRDSKTRPYVEANLKKSAFDKNFAEAMVAMTNIGVKVSLHEGEIRKQCQYVN